MCHRGLAISKQCLGSKLLLLLLRLYLKYSSAVAIGDAGKQTSWHRTPRTRQARLVQEEALRPQGRTGCLGHGIGV